jgi:hypothetical protein
MRRAGRHGDTELEHIAGVIPGLDASIQRVGLQHRHSVGLERRDR